MIERRDMFPEDETVVLEKTAGDNPYRFLGEGVRYYYDSEDGEEYLYLFVMDRAIEFPVSYEDLRIDQQGTIEFDWNGGTYRIRRFEESDKEWSSTPQSAFLNDVDGESNGD
jgi:hypothetical protein